MIFLFSVNFKKSSKSKCLTNTFGFMHEKLLFVHIKMSQQKVNINKTRYLLFKKSKNLKNHLKFGSSVCVHPDPPTF